MGRFLSVTEIVVTSKEKTFRDDGSFVITKVNHFKRSIMLNPDYISEIVLKNIDDQLECYLVVMSNGSKYFLTLDSFTESDGVDNVLLRAN